MKESVHFGDRQHWFIMFTYEALSILYSFYSRKRGPLPCHRGCSTRPSGLVFGDKQWHTQVSQREDQQKGSASPME